MRTIQPSAHQFRDVTWAQTAENGYLTQPEHELTSLKLLKCYNRADHTVTNWSTPMATQFVTLQLPALLYQQLEARARQTQRSIEDEAVETLVSAVPLIGELPPDLDAAISPLSLLRDDELRQAARTSLAADAAQQIELLHFKRQREGLTEIDEQTLTKLMHQYERAMLVRAQATALLRQRGYDISDLLRPA